jgi:hypothetical protein
VRLELDYDFIRRINIELDAEDLRLGVSLALISAATAVNLAADSVARGSVDPIILGIAEVDSHDAASARQALRATDLDEVDLFPPQAVRKWVYLELRAAYELRDRLQDPLGFVEDVYASFDYPPAVASFVRYMPPPPGAPIGEEALYARWRVFLTEEGTVLTRREPRP